MPRRARSTAPAAPASRLSGAARRAAILELLTASAGPLAGEALADRFAVSRQAIVHDIAVLRAEGAPIMATIRGYIRSGRGDSLPHRAVVTVRHRPDETEDELLTMVRAGVRVADVIVDHPVYGALRGELQLASAADVREWAASTRRSGVRFLSELTDGVHLHTIEAASERDLEEARRGLAERGYLISPEEPQP
jgi:transcriptional regulator of NAD metabolism